MRTKDRFGHATRGTVVRAEFAHSINGVQGRMFNAIQDGPDTFANQKWSASREYTEDGERYRMKVRIRFDDDCQNGHNSFSITCDIDRFARGSWREDGGGAAHERIAQRFPELEPLIRWHLVSTDGPMHYVANTVYLAGDRDYNGRRKSEVASVDHGVRFGNSPITHRLKHGFDKWVKKRYGTGSFVVTAIAHKNSPGETYKFGPKYTFDGFGTEWHECPFYDKAEADEWARALNECAVEFVVVPTSYSEGKERELDKARRVSVWPDATDAELSAEPEQLKAALEARLPKLIADFRADVEAAGFLWSPSDGK